jgi:ferredoxin-thioredoxin reductase catalytic chain
MSSTTEKSPADVRRFAGMVAAKQGWRLPADAAFMDQVLAGLRVNHNRYGYYLCPCREGHGNKTQDDDIVCPCEYAWPDIDEFGHCFCGLYLRTDFADAGRGPEPVPERRPIDRMPE